MPHGHYRTCNGVPQITQAFSWKSQKYMYWPHVKVQRERSEIDGGLATYSFLVKNAGVVGTGAALRLRTLHPTHHLAIEQSVMHEDSLRLTIMPRQAHRVWRHKHTQYRTEYNSGPGVHAT